MKNRVLFAFMVLAFGGLLIACDEEGTPQVDGSVQDDAAAPDMGLPDGPGADMAKKPDAAADLNASPDMAKDAPAPDQKLPDQLIPDLMQPDAPAPLHVTISYPPRAAMLTGSQTITIQGQVNGPVSFLKDLTINGQKVTPASGGTFTLPMTASWGLNVISAQITDLLGRVNTRAQSYYWSSKYWGWSSTPASMAVTSGALGRLYQKAIDDGNRSTLNDLASIMEKVINAVDLNSQVPSTLVSGSYKTPPLGWPVINYSVKKSGTMTYSPFKITMSAISGGVRVTGATASMEIPLTASAGITVSGKVKVTNLDLLADILVSKASGGPVNVSVSSIKMNYSSLKVDLGSGILSAIASAITNAIISLFKGTIITAFQNEIKKALPGPVKSFITGFSLATGFALPADLGGKTLSIYSDLDVIAFDTSGGTLKLNTAVHGTKAVPDGKLGTCSIGGTITPPTTSATAMTAGLRYDTLNQALAAAWYIGALKQDLTKYMVKSFDLTKLPFKISSLTFEIDAQLPPILMPGTGSYDFMLGVGDLFVKTDIVLPGSSGGTGGTLTLEGYVSAATGGNVSFSAKNEITISLANQLSGFDLEVSKFTSFGVNIPTLGALSLGIKAMVNQVLPLLAPSIVQQFPIPAIDLGSLAGSYGIPKGTVLKIQNGKLSLQSYHLLFSGDLN